MSAFDLIPALNIGHIVEVSGTAIRVELSGDVTELTRTHEGRVYPIGQIGSIVKVHFGRRLVFGFVTLLRMRSEELLEVAKPIPPEPKPISLDSLKEKIKQVSSEPVHQFASKDRSASAEEMNKLKDLISAKITPSTGSGPTASPSATESTPEPPLTKGNIQEVPEDVLRKILEE